LRTLYNALKVMFDTLNRSKGKASISNVSTPEVSVSKKVYTGESSKPFSKRVSQFTTYSLQKGRKLSKIPSFSETVTSKRFSNPNASIKMKQVLQTPIHRFTPVKQVWRPKQSFSKPPNASKEKNHVFQTPHSRFTPVKQVWKPKQSYLKPFKYIISELLSLQHENDSALNILNIGRFPFITKTNLQREPMRFNSRWKSSSSDFKTPRETPGFSNNFQQKKSFKSPLIPRVLFQNETTVLSPRWNSTSLNQIDTTYKWISKFGKPVGTVLKWVPKVVV
jgi:hypothetical protein